MYSKTPQLNKPLFPPQISHPLKPSVGLFSVASLPGKSKPSYSAAAADTLRQRKSIVPVRRCAPARASASEGMSEKMSAWVYSEYGGVEVLRLENDVSLPEINDDQVLIKVKAAALNPVDFKRRLGKFQNSDSPLPVIFIT